MKARITGGTEKTVLHYGLSPQHMQALELSAADAGAKLTAAYDTSLTIGALIKGEGGEPKETVPAEECLVFAGFDRQSLNALLEDLKASGVRIPLKAVLTPHNSGWTLGALIDELRREHEHMTGGGSE